MFYDELAATIDGLVNPGKGILAADESNGTMGKRLASINTENTEENRRNFRLLLAKTPDLENYVNGVILFEETLSQTDDQGKTITQLFADKGIIPGIKVDKGLITLANTDDEKVTQGLDGLHERLETYKALGARFAKWRNVYAIDELKPSMTAVKAGAENLARYAAICQSLGIVPIVEPEVLIDGPHTIEQCAEVSEIVLHELFHALFIHQVDLEHIVLKPSMVIAGSEAQSPSTPEDVAEFTLSVFRNNVPVAVPTINFLSGGQTPEQATENLNAINSIGTQPWNLTFSYGRALQEHCIKTWNANKSNIDAAQKTLLKRARLNSAANLGEYNIGMEND
jgi:fructose-bisphosphate aldolase, class I